MKYYDIQLQDKVKGPMNYPEGIPAYEAAVGSKAVDYLYYHDANNLCHLLLCIPDQITGIARQGVVEITAEQAALISETFEPKTEKITDEAKVRRLEIKAALGQEFTADELKAIDPNEDVPGFGFESTLASRISTTKK